MPTTESEGGSTEEVAFTQEITDDDGNILELWELNVDRQLIRRIYVARESES